MHLGDELLGPLDRDTGSIGECGPACSVHQVTESLCIGEGSVSSPYPDGVGTHDDGDGFTAPRDGDFLAGENPVEDLGQGSSSLAR